MWSASLYQKDPAASRFVAGGLAEAEQLLGSPLPPLPPPDREGGRNIFAVRFHPQLRTLLLRFLQGLLGQIGTEGTVPPARAGRDLPRDQASGLLVIGDILKDVEGIEFVRFGGEDVVRHKLVQRIVAAYNEYAEQQAPALRAPRRQQAT